jgi:hypothetical protein
MPVTDLALDSKGAMDALTHKLTHYDLFDKTKYAYDFNVQGIKNIHSTNPISDVFFSQQNIDILQNGIRYVVYKRTHDNLVIDKQSENELLIIMRSIYLQYSKHKPFGVLDQVRMLNSKVIDYAVPAILVELNQYVNYTRDASALPVPLEHSKNISPKGTKVLYNSAF